MNEAELSLLRNQVKREASRLKDEFAGIFNAETIERYINESWDSLTAGGPRLPNFLPIFVRRFTRERLQALAQVEGKLSKEHPEVLFVCLHNAGRSQMAAVLTSHLSDGRVHVRSAGSTPANEINGQVVEAMAEVGLDISQEFPKVLNDEFVMGADVVITMGCGDACLVYPGKRYVDWEVEDPAGQPIETVRRIRDDITGLVGQLLLNLGVGPLPAGCRAFVSRAMRSRPSTSATFLDGFDEGVAKGVSRTMAGMYLCRSSTRTGRWMARAAGVAAGRTR